MNEELQAVLDTLAERFGSTGAALWTDLVQYEVVLAIGLPVSLFFASAVLFAISYFTSDDFKTEPISFLCGFLAALALIVFLVVLPASIATIVAPEASVINGLLS